MRVTSRLNSDKVTFSVKLVLQLLFSYLYCILPKEKL